MGYENLFRREQVSLSACSAECDESVTFLFIDHFVTTYEVESDKSSLVD